MASSLVKYMNQRRDRDGRPIWWGRADIDGLPFLGEPPALKKEEFEERAVVAKNTYVRVYDMDQDEDFAEYQQLLDRHVNGLSVILYIKRFAGGENKHYVEFYDKFMVDGAARASQASLGVQQLENGRAPLPKPS